MIASHSPIKGIVGKVLYLRGEGGLWRSHETEGEEARFTLTVPRQDGKGRCRNTLIPELIVLGSLDSPNRRYLVNLGQVDALQQSFAVCLFDDFIQNATRFRVVSRSLALGTAKPEGLSQ